MDEYNEHSQNMDEMKSLGKNLAKKKKLFKKRKELEGKRSIFDSFEGSYANYKISTNNNSRSRPAKTYNRTTVGSTRHSRGQLINYASQDQRVLVPGPGDASRVIFSKTSSTSKGNLLIRSSRDGRKSTKKTRNFMSFNDDPNEIEEAIQARV